MTAAAGYPIAPRPSSTTVQSGMRPVAPRAKFVEEDAQGSSAAAPSGSCMACARLDGFLGTACAKGAPGGCVGAKSRVRAAQAELLYSSRSRLRLSGGARVQQRACGVEARPVTSCSS